MSAKIILVTGGARSGKSTYAERYVASIGSSVAYIATAQVLDGEMESRVALHRHRRPAEWQIFEAPYDAEKTLAEAVATADAVLFDCMTLYVSNLLLSPDAPPTPEERFALVQRKIALLLESARAGSATVVFVTNEVGLGIVPDNALAREYRDLSGAANQQAAAAADEVYLVVSGLAVELKKIATAIHPEV